MEEKEKNGHKHHNNINTSKSDIKNIKKEIEFLECLGSAAFIIYKGQIVVANSYAVKFTGYTDIKSILGKTIDKVIKVYSTSKKIFEDVSNKIQNGCRFSSVKLEVYNLFQERKNIKMVGSNHIFKEKTAIMVVITKNSYHDEATKLVTEDKYRDIVKLLPEPFFMTCNGKFVDINDAGLKLLDINELEELNQFDIKDFIHPDDIKLVMKKRKVLYNNKRIPIPLECRLKKKDGATQHIEVTASSFDTPDGISIIIVARDVTLRKMIANFLKESEERYSTLVELLPDTILITDDKRVLFVNNAGVKLLEESNKGTIIGKNILDFIKLQEDQIYIKDLINKLFSNKINYSVIEQKITSRNNRILDLEIASTLINYNNQKALLHVIRDITERKKAEENVKKLEEAIEHDKLKTEFFSNISHELKTPLNILLATIQLLRDKSYSNKGSQKKQVRNRYLDTMYQNCNRLLRIINNIIDLTRLDVGFLELNFRNHNIVQIVEDITLSVAQYVENKGISLVFDTEIEEKIIACDIEKMERIILNLLSNAVKFTDKDGHIKVSIFDKGDKIVISVKDTGIGIQPHMLDKIFDRFKQVSPLFTRTHEGSGIGLSLVKLLVEAHNGRIFTKSIYGRGSEFIIELPVIVIEGEGVSKLENEFNSEEKIERINIEFSDIYNLDHSI